MKYRVIASYRAPTEPMSYEDALEMVCILRAQFIHCHIERIES